MEENLSYLEKTDSDFVRKRRYLVVACLIRMFLTGVEYTVILPSVWLYIKTFSVGSWFLGLVGAGYSVATLLSLPLAGRFYDRTKKAKEIILVMNMFEIVGNIVYALHFSPWLPLLGRVIAGIGDGFYVITFSEIPSLIRRKSITRMFAILELGSILGIVLGPSFNLLLEKSDFWIGNWHINFATSPGLFMAFVWIVMQVLTIFMISNMSLKYEPSGRQRSLSVLPSSEGAVVEKDKHAQSKKDQKPLLAGDSSSSESEELEDYELKPVKNTRKSSVLPQNFLESFREVCSIDIAIIIFNDCILWLSQIEFEILAPLIGEEDLGFTETSLSYFYIIGGVQLLVVFTIIWYLSGKVYDIHFSICSAVMTSISLALMIVYQVVRDRFAIKLVLACCIAILVFSSIPLNLVAGRAMLTKICKPRNQGLVIGVYSALCRIALVLGPLIGSSAFPNLAPLGGIMLPLCITALGGLLLRKRFIIEKQVAREMELLFSD